MKNGAASGGLGLIGFIVGTAAGQRNIAAGIGYYSAAVSIYERIIRRGKEVTFPHNTRLEFQTTVRLSTPMIHD